MAATEFTKFPLLPAELRREIWAACLPRRVVEIDRPLMEPLSTTCRLIEVTERNGKPPAISRVCREARDVAFDRGCGIWDSIHPENVDWDEYDGPTLTANPWFQRGLDTAHLHWTDHYNDALDPGDKTGDHVETVQELAYRNGGAISIMADLMVGFDDVQFSNLSDWNLNFLNLALSDKYQVVVRIVSIHVPAAAGHDSGLFGLLGDAPVQLVDAFDRQAIAAFHQLAVTYSSHQLPETTEFFALALNSPAVFEHRVREWQQRVARIWVYSIWENDWTPQSSIRPETEDCDKYGVPFKDVAFPLAPGEVEGELDEMPSGGEVAGFVDLFRRKLNTDDKYVAAKLKAMPVFRPAIMFRWCMYPCYLPKDERPPFSSILHTPGQYAR